MRVRHPGWVLAGLLLVMAAVSWFALDLSVRQLVRGWANGIEFLQDELPPDWSVLGPGWDALVQTLHIAYLGTLLGLAVSLPLSALAAQNLFPAWVSTPARGILAAIRVLPSLLWALLFVIVVGFGPLAGVLAIGFYSVGYLGKLQYETLEGLPSASLDVARATGASRFQLVRWVALPEAGNALVSQALFMFEYNVRASTIVGIVGAGGIGQLMNRYLSVQQYDRIFTLLFLIFLAVVVIDWLSLKIRGTFLEKAPPSRPGWGRTFAEAIGIRRRH